ncbi:M20 family metallopeptidase [Neobacillus mesonae]|uniref:Peptidase M20 domain-containing protein 2 n=1 Tax=Neobacillus mesonae TaxID=1193713 RepID=A0A3T0I4W5_9BACI|nr:M20 family metallopeptidase [Neobacillus mesonae]AZU64426.1 amidohydrolase [Neobacillus mesonae]
MKKLLVNELKEIEQYLRDLSDHLYENPELGDQEFESMQRFVEFLTKYHFEVETNIVNRPTAFKAEFKSGKPGPTIAFLAEYDALPRIGHGCGHNMIGTMSAGAAVILSKILKNIGGSLIVLGTPAEETNGAKVTMSDEGVFENIDVAMILHPADQSYESGTFSAMDALQFTYTGKSSHAASSPEEGINALDSVIQLFNGINALRQHVPSDVRIHGIISEGGQAANVVPDLAIAKFYIRAKERSVLNHVVEKIKSIAHGAAAMAGTALDISNYELSYDNMITNYTLSQVFTKNLKEISAQPILPAEHSYGSIDMGNVSKVVPAIHPFIGLNDPGLTFHTKAFADRTVTSEGHQALSDGALALAQTGYDVITNVELLERIKLEFQKNLYER